jgi:DNA processing protein
LYNQIIENDGLVVTEYKPDIKPSSKRFLERNRIVSGLSIGILVVEAAHRSGTSVTAKLATEQGKRVFVLPHEIGDIHGVGTNRLIRNGAILVTSPKEIIEEFEFLEYKELKINKTNIKKNIKKEYQEIYNLIFDGTNSLDELCKTTNIKVKDINNILFMLELEGNIIKTSGGYKCI